MFVPLGVFFVGNVLPLPLLLGNCREFVPDRRYRFSFVQAFRKKAGGSRFNSKESSHRAEGMVNEDSGAETPTHTDLRLVEAANFLCGLSNQGGGQKGRVRLDSEARAVGQ